MKNSIHLSFRYLKYYKQQTLTLLAGILLSTALLTGMGGLFESGLCATREDARTKYGDWHYSMRGDTGWFDDFEQELPKKGQGSEKGHSSEKKHSSEKGQGSEKEHGSGNGYGLGKGYTLEKAGVETVRKAIEEPFSIQLVYADPGYLEMMGRDMIEGVYPRQEHEIAADAQTLQNLGVPEELGTRVVLDGEAFTLCGILGEMPEKLPELLGDSRQVFVNPTLDYGTNGTFVYLKFDESHKVYDQMEAFRRQFGIAEDVHRNNGLAGYTGGEAPAQAWEVIRTGLSHREAGLPYIWGTLNREGRLTETVILLAAAFFGVFVIYSLFQISVIRRMSQYSVMQTLGMTDGCQMAVLFCELAGIGLVGYPVGCVLGNLAGRLVYRRAGQIFLLQDQTRHTGGGWPAQELGAVSLPDAGAYQASRATMLLGALCLGAAFLVISGIFICRTRKLSIRQRLGGDLGKHRNPKIYSIRHGNLTGILTRKFMFSRKGMFVGILLSLSIGSVIFLGAFYVTENTEINNELTFKADDGLGSDIQVYIQSDRLTDGISGEAAGEMRGIPGIREFHPVRYLLGELALNDGTFLWLPYFAELANEEGFLPDPELMEKYNGLAVQTGEDDYALKVNIYGYDDAMLENLNEYLLEGEIDPDQMRRDNRVILKTLMDGQGNYDGVRVAPGDEISLTTVSSPDVPQEALRFQGESGWYQSVPLDVAAVVSRPLAKVDTYIGDEGTSVIDIIMTNEQMEQNFGVKDYQTVSISADPKTGAGAVSSGLGSIAENISRCVVKDYSEQIRRQNLYLYQKMFFYYGIAAVLLGISLLHIMNSMQYLVAARRREFGILRAMGITDAGFRRMLAKEGLCYGICSGITVGVIYFAVQKILYYFMVHVYRYLHPRACVSWTALGGVLLLNIVICVAMALLSGRSILREPITEEIRE